MVNNSTLLVQLSVDELKEVIKEVVLSVTPPGTSSKDLELIENETDVFLTREEAMNMLKVSFTTLWKWEKSQ